MPERIDWYEMVRAAGVDPDAFEIDTLGTLDVPELGLKFGDVHVAVFPVEDGYRVHTADYRDLNPPVSFPDPQQAVQAAVDLVRVVARRRSQKADADLRKLRAWENGPDRLHAYFGLSYASWLTLPRVLMARMPDDWQYRMADLLAEWEDAWPEQPEIGTRVMATRDGRLVPMPRFLIDYRHPDLEAIERLRGPKTPEGE